MARIVGLLGLLACAALLAEAAGPRDAQREILKMDTRAQAAQAHHWHHTDYTSHSEIMRNLKKDADNQKVIMAAKHAAHRGDSTAAASMSPHLAMHSTRGEEAEGRHRGRAHHPAVKTQQSIHGVLKLPPDEATPFFETYVLQYAFPTIAIICTCLACVLYRTMRMYQKERWKGTSYFHGARRSAESLLPGLK